VWVLGYSYENSLLCYRNINISTFSVLGYRYVAIFFYLILAIKITLISTMNIKCKQPYLHTSRKKMLMIGKKNHKFRNANDRKKKHKFRITLQNLMMILKPDATILFDSLTHIYLIFFLCYIYKMHWYCLFYVLKALLNVRFEKK
jgi:hypothetical protein